MKNYYVLFSLALVLCFAGSIAEAQVKRPRMPNLIGTWECRGEGLLLGDGNHIPDQAGTPSAVEITNTFVFTSQEGHRVFGVKSSQWASEQVIGVVGFNNTTLEMVDQDGFITCTFTGRKRATAMYREQSSTTLVASRAVCLKQ